MGVIVIGDKSFALLGKQPAHASKQAAALESELLERAYRWVDAEAQPKGRIVLMSERELFEWAAREGLEHAKGALTHPSSGRTQACFASLRPPLMSNVRPHVQ